VFVDKGRKRMLLARLIGSNNWPQVLVFTRTKHGANRLCEQLCDDGLPSTALHGNKSQGARTKALADFKNGKVRVLVATDIAARGIDIDSLPHVVNYDLPMVPEDYVHRIGRTGRAGMEGEALSLVDYEERGLLRDIQRLLKREIAQFKVEGFEPTNQPSSAADLADSRGNRPQHPPRGRSHHAQPRGNSAHARPNEGKRHSARPGSSHGSAARSTQGNTRRQPRA
jgi:ATP-dependent RNA helicase RhlE